MHIFPVTVEIDEHPVSLVAVQFSPEQTIETLFDSIYTGFPEIRMQASALVLRPDVRDQFAASDLISACEGHVAGQSAMLSAIAEALADPDIHFGRFRSLPVHILHTDDFQPVLSSNINPLSNSHDLIEEHLALPIALDEIRDAEMRFLVDKSRAFLPPIEGTYYLAPSNKPARSFLRVGNVQYSRQSIDAVTFWLLPHLKDSKAVLADTWSLSSIAMNASRVLAHLRRERPVPVEMLSQYQDASQDRQAALMEILDRLVDEVNQEFGQEGLESGDIENSIPVSCLMSATQSGSLVDVLKDQKELSGLNIDFDFVALFSLGKTGQLPALCDMSDDPGFAKIEDEEIAELAPITVDPQVYFPLRYLNVELTPMVPEAEVFRPFLDMVMGHGILSVHRDQATDGLTRHHGIHVDMERLFALPAFVEQFEVRLAALDPVPTVILTPLHAAAEILADLAANILNEVNGCRPTIIRHTSLELREEGATAEHDAQVRSELTNVPAESAILVLDDCYITGARMTGYQTRLRQLAVQARLHYLVGLARPDNGDRWELFRRRVSYRAKQDRQQHSSNTVDAVFNVCLPNWQDRNCPWCREAAFYESCKPESDEAQFPDFMVERQAMLTDRDAGLSDNLFFVLDGAPPLKLHSGSIFTADDCNCSQAEIFTAVAASLQHLRVNGGGRAPLGPRRYPVATVIQSSNYLHEMYTDSILRASILRGAGLEELVYADRDKERDRSDYISTIMTSTEADKNDLRAEIIVAHALHKCTVAESLEPAALAEEAREFLGIARSVAKPG